MQRAPPAPTDAEKLDDIFVFLSGELYAEDQAAEAINLTKTIFAAPAPAAGGSRAYSEGSVMEGIPVVTVVQLPK